MFDPDVWLRQQFWEQLWKGPGAVSAYWSIAIQLVCVGLSALGPTNLQGPNLWILSIIVLLGVLLILALDLLSRIASRYGRCGRKVFEANQNPIVSAMELFDCVPLPDADEMLIEPLRDWLKEPPAFDPEGWALTLFSKVLTSRLA